MTTGNQYNTKFKSHLGEGGTKAHKYCHMSGGPWCCAEVSLVYGETNKSLFYGGKYCTYCPNAIKWCRAFLAELPMYLAMGGDIIFFDWNANGVPDHIGEVDYRIDTDKIATVEGNTGSPARVRKKVRPRKYVLGVFRPLYAPATTPTKEALKIDGAFEYKSIYMLQVALGLTPTGIFDKETVKAWQKKIGTTPDGSWQKKTTLAGQKFLKVKQDGAWGIDSTKAFQRWINNVCFPSVSGTTATKPTTKTTTSTKAQKAVTWGRLIIKSGGYKYKKWNNKDKKTKQCPICHKLTGKYKGWNCIGFVSACFFHGADVKSVACSCSGIGTDSFFTKVTEASWKKRNGNSWKMITNGGSKGGADIPASKLTAGDVLICYDSKGKFKHIALYAGNGKILESTKTRTPNVGERTYKDLCGRHHVTRASCGCF